MRTHPLRPNLVLALTCLLAILLFFLGLAVPGAHLWGSYLLPIVLAFLWGRRRDIYIVTALASLLMVVTFWTGGIPTGGDFLTNHLLPILLLWAVAWLLTRRRQLQENLDAQVTARTAALGASEAQLAKLFRANPGAIAITRQSDGCYLDANPAYLQLLGFTRDELVGRRSVDLGLLSAPARAEIVDRFRRGAATVPFEVPLHTKTGATIDVMTAIDTIDFAGEPCYLSFMVDITARKQLEARASRLAALVDAAQDAVMSADLDGTIVTLNRSAEALYGTSADAVVGQNMVRLTQPDYVAPLQEMLGRISQGEAATLDDIAWTLPDGSTRSLSIALSPIQDESGQVRGFASSARDVTVRNQMAREVVRLAAIVHASNDAIISADLDGTLRSMNHAAEQLFGITAGEAIGRHISLINPDLPEADRAAMFARLVAGELFTLPDLTWTAADGRRVDLSVTALPFLDPAGQVQGVASIARDITARKAAEREHLFLSALVTSSPDAVVGRTVDGTILSWNHGAEQLFGYTADEAIGQNLTILSAPDSLVQMQADMAAVAQGHPVEDHDTQRMAKNGRIFDCRVSMFPVRDNAGAIVGVASFTHDVTERKQLEATVSRLAAIVESSSDAIASTDLQGRVVSWNHSAEQLYGCRAADAIGCPINELLPPVPATDEAAIVAKVRSGATVSVADRALTKADGTKVDLSIVLSPVKDKQGAVIGVASITRDITARKRLEADLRQSEQKWRTVFEFLPVGVSVVNSRDQVADSNPALAQILHITPEGMQQGQYAQRRYFRPDGTPMPPEEFPSQRALREGEVVRDVEIGVEKEDGELLWVSVSATPESIDGLALTVTTDITERKRAEAERLAQAERWNMAAEISSIGVWDWRTGSDEVMWDERMYLLHGVAPRTALTFAAWRALIHPDDRAAVEANSRKSGLERTRIPVEYRVVLPDGSLRYLLSIGGGLYDAAGAPVRQLGITMDITARKRLEAALRNSEARYRLLVDSAEDVIWTVDMEGRFTFVNPAVERQLGYRPEEVIGQRIDRWLTPASAAAAMEMFAAAAVQVRAGQRPEIPQFEGEQIRKDGTQIFTQTVGVPLVDEAGRPSGFQGITRDVTERRQIEAKLQESLTKYSILFDTAPIGISLTDDTGQLIEGNREAEQILGISQADQLRRTFDSPVWTIVRPDGTPMLASEYASVRALNEQKRVDSVEMGIIRNDGETRWITVNAAPIPLPGFGVAITYADITARKQMEAALAASERKYRDLYDNSPDMYFVGIPTQGLVLDCNQTLARTLGYAADELIGGPSNVMFTPGSYMQLQAARAELLDAGSHDNYEVQLCRRDGTLLDALMSVTLENDPAGGPARARVTLHDITERKRAELALAASEAQLRASQARYQMLADYSTDVIWSMDTAGKVTYVSPSSVRQSGFTPEETMCQTLEEAVAPSSRTALRSAVGELYGLIRSGQPVPATPNVYEMLRKDGSAYWGETIYSVVYDDQGEFQQLIGATREVTKRVHAERKLSEAYQRVRLAADAADIGIWNWDFDDDGLEWDDRICDIYAVPRAMRTTELYHQFWRERVHPDDLAVVDTSLAEVRRDGTEWSSTFRIVLPGGEVRYIYSAAIVEQDQLGVPVRMIGINRDITDQVLYEQLLQDTNAVLEQRVAERTADLQAAVTELQRASKLRDEFLAMISHELRTPLMGVLSMSEMLEDQIAGPLNARQTTYVEAITHSGERLMTVINSILSYTHLLSGKVKLDVEPCDLAYLLATCASSQQHKATAKCQAIAVQVQPPDLAITADVTALAEVIKRLLDNAVKFTPEGGQIGLEANRGTAPNTVDLVVWDTGIGIPADQFDQVFHAFTQADGRLSRSHEGIGLGLAYVDEMVHLMGGKIALSSTPGEGSRFTITLPESL